MKYSNDGPPLSESADAQRMRQYIEACQAAVDAWQDMDMWTDEAVWHLQHPKGSYAATLDEITTANHEIGAARGRAKIAMLVADSLL